MHMTRFAGGGRIPQLTLLGLTLSAAVALTSAAPPATQPATSPASQPALSGRLSKHGPLNMLEVWGEAEAAGFAHGYLLGEQIVKLFDGFVFDERVGLPVPVYESMARSTQLRNFTFEPRFERELEGLMAGMQARLGATIMCRSLDRPIDLDDLKVVNVLSDLLGIGCATFAVWGGLTEGGAPLTARNLDYPATPALIEHQIVMVHRGRENGRPWIGVTWPGLIGCYTAMNDAGVTISIHDVPGRPTTAPPPFAPRSLTLRTALESADGVAFIDRVQGVLRQHRCMVGSNVFVSGPVHSDEAPAAVFECDGDERDGGVTVRRPNGEPGSTLACTNHMRLREAPATCRRYTLLQERFRGVTDRARLDVSACFAALDEVSQERRLQTVHSVVFEPAALRMHVRLRGGPKAATQFDVWRVFDQRSPIP